MQVQLNMFGPFKTTVVSKRQIKAKPAVTPAAMSREAQVKIQPSSRTLQTMILEYIKEQKKNGSTCWECETALSLKHQTASARCKELRDANLIVLNGKFRPTDSGCNAAVYLIAKDPVPPTNDKSLRIYLALVPIVTSA